ncbi:MAG: hypothetical protein K2X27_19910 [Candidatus Obscuribacterales bacterium]|nr:hypothetical protein [Candidatus Obscuribacterales bacterium]
MAHGAGRSGTESNSRVGRKRQENKKPRVHGRWLLFFGVLLPLAAMLFETGTHFCARHFFDPFPSLNHIVLFSLIPLSNLLAYLSLHRNLTQHYGFMALANGMAMGVGVMYALMFLPLTITAFVYTFALGFGLFALAPLLSLPCSFLAGKTVAALAEIKKTYFNPHQVEHLGHLIVLIMVVSVELPSTLTRIHLSMAANPKSSQAGVKWLRQFGSQEVLLRACYERSGRATDIVGSLYEAAHPVGIEDARRIFYKVTGKAFNSVPIPASARATIQHAGLVSDPAGLNADVQDEFDLDADIAGEKVSGVARGLKINKGKIEGTVDSDALLAKYDLSFSFANESPYDREARAKINLPAGACVDKAILTYNGVPHEAKIMVRSQARQIYQEAVMQHKEDPLLLSMSGPDQILLQCFPVHPKAAMSVTISIVSPLIYDSEKNALLNLPAFAEKNFQSDEAFDLKLLSNRSLETLSTKKIKFESREVSGAQRQSWESHGVFPANQLAAPEATLRISRNPAIDYVYSEDAVNPERRFCLRRISAPHITEASKLYLVIDASAEMAAHLPEIGSALKSLPAEKIAGITVVRDKSISIAPEKAAVVLKEFQAAGGQDDSPALYEALEKAAGSADAAVLWLHASQPVSDAADELLKSRLKRFLTASLRSPILYDLQLQPGPVELMDGLQGNSSLLKLAYTGDLKADFERLVRAWRSPQFRFEFRFPENISADESYKKVSKDLCAIAAYQLLCRAVNDNDTESYAIAEDYHLVSPVSSAVVVEEIPQLDAVSYPVPAPAPDPVETFAAAINPANMYWGFRYSLSDSFQRISSNLNRLNSVSSGDSFDYVSAPSRTNSPRRRINRRQLISAPVASGGAVSGSYDADGAGLNSTGSQLPSSAAPNASSYEPVTGLSDKEPLSIANQYAAPPSSGQIQTLQRNKARAESVTGETDSALSRESAFSEKKQIAAAPLLDAMKSVEESNASLKDLSDKPSVKSDLTKGAACDEIIAAKESSHAEIESRLASIPPPPPHLVSLTLCFLFLLGVVSLFRRLLALGKK